MQNQNFFPVISPVKHMIEREINISHGSKENSLLFFFLFKFEN